MRIDLHTHSRVSDGTDTPAELLRAAQAAGVDMVGLTDHDTTDGWGEAYQAADELGLGLVPGMELSTQHQGHSVHLLAYLHDPTYQPLGEEIDKILSGRDGRVARMVEILNGLDLPITVEDVLAESADAVSTGRPHVADALVRRGMVRDRDEAFRRYLSWGKPAYVERYAPDLVSTIAMVSAAGGVTVVAHPWGRSGESHRLDEAAFAYLKAQGLSGIEVDHQDHDIAMRAQLAAIAHNLDLVVTGSSDYHGRGKKDHELGVNVTTPEELEKLMDRAKAVAAVSGRRTPAVVMPR
ncbi:PHP domain-containing protein [Nocardioides sp.]|uniref:PHP domain-containing protein n=1 Tax=Nocardioides sp. TaxID=35761 RepID=UPI00260F2B8D|nr:PHP domain-containing protein [Nocardioides sp.]